MAMHTVIGGSSLAAGAASIHMIASASSAPAGASDVVAVVTGVITAAAAIVGTAVAVVSFLRHRNAADALEAHQLHDDERFDRLEAMIEGRSE